MRYRVNIETLAPLHIGSGGELIGEFDYTSSAGSGHTYILNQNAIHKRELEKNGARARLDLPAAKLITAADLKDGSPFVRYKVKGEAELQQLREQLKDVRGAVYLPGSSLKGAFRTALLTYAASHSQFSTANLKERNRAKEAAHSWERQIFGPSEQQDLLRTLQVKDSEPLFPPPLEVLLARVFVSAGDNEGAPIEIEAISEKSNFVTYISIDELTLQYVDKPQYAKDVPWQDGRLWLMNLVPILQEVGQRRIESELREAEVRHLTQMVRFYKGLKNLHDQLRGQPAALLQIGWGTGWMGTTIATSLDKATRDFLRTEYELGKPPKWNWRKQGDWKPDLSKSFPKSRRLQSKNDVPGYPFGWISLIFEPEGKPRFKEEWEELQKKAQLSFKSIGDHARVKIERRRQ